jgi:hypothetical protein
VTYDWRPTASRSATTEPSIVPPPRDASFVTPSRSRSDGITMATAIDEFVEAAEAGRALNRSGRHSKPSALRDLRGILEYHIGKRIETLVNQWWPPAPAGADG